MAGLLPSRQTLEELQDVLHASRVRIFDSVTRGGALFALAALVVNAFVSLPAGQVGLFTLYVTLFGLLLVITLGRAFPFWLRAGTLLALVYALALADLLNSGIASGNGRTALLAFPILATVLFGGRAGVWMGIVSLLTWLSAGALFSYGGFVPPMPRNAAHFTEWVDGAANLLLFLVALSLPYRQFLEVQMAATINAFQKQELQEAQASLELQARALTKTSEELASANQRQQEQARALERRASQLAVSAGVARIAATLHDLPELLHTTVTLISERFGFYHAGIFLLDDAREWAVLKAANSPGGQRMLARGHRLRVGQQGIVGNVAHSGRPRIALDVGADAVHFVNPDLPETHSEMAVPLIAHGEIIGALDVQSEKANAFSEDDVEVLQTLADQLAVAIDNARLFEETQRQLRELRDLRTEPLLPAARPTPAEKPMAYRYDGVEITPAVDQPDSPAPPDRLHIPIIYGNATLGTLELAWPDAGWSPEDVELTRAIADRMALALENARLFETTRASLAETARLYRATRIFASAQNMDDVLRGILANAVDPHLERFLIGLLETGPDRRVTEMQVVALWRAGEGPAYGLTDRFTADALPFLRQLEPGYPLLFESLSAPEVDERSRQFFMEHNSQAAAVIPVVSGGTLVALFLAATREPHAFTFDEIRPLQALADQAATAIENIRLLDETQKRIAELITLNSISQVLTSQSDINTLLEQVGERILRTFGVPIIDIALYNRAANQIEFVYSMDNGQRLHDPPLPLGQGLSSLILRTRQPLLLNYDTERRAAELGAHLIGPPAKSYLGVPLLVGDEAIGLISLQSTEREGLFEETDLRLLTTIAASVGVAIQNARLFAEARRRVAELATLNDISRIVTAQIGPEAMFHQIGQKVLETFDAPNGYIALYDARTNLISLPFFVEKGQLLTEDPFPLGEGLTSHILRTRQPLLLNYDTERRAAELGAKIAAGTSPAKSFLGVPILVGDEAIGVINIQDVDNEGRFSEADARLLGTIAASVSGAIQNARLLAETQRRAQQLAAAAEVSRATISIFDSNELIVRAVELIRERFELYYAAIFLVDEVGQWAALRHATGEAGRELLARGHRLEVGGQSMVGWSVANRQARIALDVGVEKVRFANPLLPLTRSEMALPLAVGDRVLGALDVQSTQVNAFSEADITVLQTMADQIAIALRNAQSLEALTYERNLLHTLLENVPDKIYFKDPQSRFIRVSRAVADQFGLLPEQVVGKSDFDFFTEAHARQAFDDEQALLRSGKPVLGQIERERWPDQPDTWALTSKLPMRNADGEIIGSFGISRDVTELKNAQEAAQRRAQQLAAAAEVSRASISVLDPYELIVQAVELIRERFELYYAAIFLVDEVGQWAALRHATGEAGRELLARGHRLEVGGQSMVGWCVANRQARIALDVGQEAVRFANPLLPLTRSEMALPLAVGDRVLGALDVQSTQVNAFSEADITVLQTMADQIAIALQNAQLFREVAQERENITLLYDVLKALSVSMEMMTIINTILRFAPRLGAQHAYILLLGDHIEDTIFRSTIPGLDRFNAREARDFALAIAKGGLERWVLENRRPAVVADTRSDERWYTAPQHAAEQPARSVISVPLQTQRGLTGVLAYTHSVPGALTEERVPLIESIAGQVAVALENARLFDQRRIQQYNASALARATQALSRTLSEAELTQILADELFQTFKPVGVSLFRWDVVEDVLTPIAVRFDAETSVSADWPTLDQSLPASARPDLTITIQSREGAIRPVREESDLQVREAMTMPLIYGGQVEAVVEIVHLGPQPGLGESDLELFRDLLAATSAQLQTIRLYELQRQTAERLAEVDRLKSQFLANMSHELRTPLNSIIGFSRVILKGIDGPLTDLQTQDLGSIYNSGQHLLGLINDILDMARIEAGKMELVFDEVDLHDTFKGVMATTTALIKDKPIVLREEIAPDLPTVRADTMRVRQVLINLLSNAAKFTDRGSITLRARPVESLTPESEVPQKFVEISVSDTGPGISREDMAKLFEPFSQVDASPTRKVGGSGLGLSICRNLVDLHRGRIWAESEGLPGEGATFYFSLPVYRPEPERAPLPAEVTDGSPTILVVDDDQGILRLYRRYLEPHGFNVVGVSKAAEALPAAVEHRPAAILLDVLMPTQDGWKVLEDLKRHAATRDIPIVMCTIATDQARAFELGAADYLVKPILEADLLRVFTKLRINGKTQKERAFAAPRP